MAHSRAPLQGRIGVRACVPSKSEKVDDERCCVQHLTSEKPASGSPPDPLASSCVSWLQGGKDKISAVLSSMSVGIAVCSQVSESSSASLMCPRFYGSTGGPGGDGTLWPCFVEGSGGSRGSSESCEFPISWVVNWAVDCGFSMKSPIETNGRIVTLGQ